MHRAIVLAEYAGGCWVVCGVGEGIMTTEQIRLAEKYREIESLRLKLAIEGDQADGFHGMLGQERERLAAERALVSKLRAELERLRWAHDQSGGDIGVLERKLAEAEAQVQELTKDRLRLQWLIGDACIVSPTRTAGAKLHLFTGPAHSPQTAIQMIDAAMNPASHDTH